MVRLKVIAIAQIKHSIPFQFHYGTIKSFDMRGEDIHKHYFNSTMVRLKVAILYSKHQLDAFQFHYGTIKSIFVAS